MLNAARLRPCARTARYILPKLNTTYLSKAHSKWGTLMAHTLEQVLYCIERTPVGPVTNSLLSILLLFSKYTDQEGSITIDHTTCYYYNAGLFSVHLNMP